MGGSELAWQGDDLTARIDERSAPWGSPLRGRVRLIPLLTSASTFLLDPDGHHTWSPRVPVARIEVDFEEPRISFRGTGYLDVNRGLGPLEDTFGSWGWSRTSVGENVAISYDVKLRDGRSCMRALGSHGGRELSPIIGQTPIGLPGTRFGLDRTGWSEPGAPMRVLRTLEDGPFYARSVVETTLGGDRAMGMHEAVSLDRFRAAWVRFLMPFRMRVEAA